MTTTDSSRSRLSGLEIRVHGIGDHEIFSALDGPTYREEITRSKVSIDGPPIVPGHRLRMVNWSRANRKLTVSTLWYLAFPFTLLNVAGYMMPTRGWLDRFFRWAIFLTGLCMTVAMAVWLAAILETAWRWRVYTPDSPVTRVLLGCVCPVIVACIVGYRQWRGRRNVNRGSRVFSVASIVALIGLTVALYYKPAGLRYPNTDRPVDVMAVFVIVTTAVALSTALALSLRAIYLRQTRRRTTTFAGKHGTSYAGAALLCLLGMVVLHAGGSVLRLATSSIADAFTPTVAPTVAPTTMLIFQPLETNPGQSIVVAAPLRIDLLPLFVVEFLVVLVVFLRLLFWISQRSETGRARFFLKKEGLGYAEQAPDGAKLQPTGKWHDRLSDLPTTLAWTALCTTAITGVLWTLTGIAIRSADLATLVFLVGLMKALGLILVGALLLRRPKSVSTAIRDVLSRLGDVAGFWSPDIHPLAGTSYRPDVLSGIDIAVNKAENGDHPIVLVGHSQGSVVSAWYVAVLGWSDWKALSDVDIAARFSLPVGTEADRDIVPAVSLRPSLITCGSPLDSLYATFFPQYFPPGFFERTERNAAGHQWVNFWRQTDPIATPLLHARNVNITETVHEPTLGHSKYFTDQRLQGDVGRLLCPHRAQGSGAGEPNATEPCAQCTSDNRDPAAPTKRDLQLNHVLDFGRRDIILSGRKKSVLTGGFGPAVIVLTELPGITPQVACLARTIRDSGFTVYLPDLFGKAGKPGGSKVYLARSITRICISREFHLLRSESSGPLAQWLRDLAGLAKDECGGRGVGVVGMCITGNFALSMMLSTAVLAPVLSQPSLPLGNKRGLNISRADLDAIKTRLGIDESLQVLGFRFSGDKLCTKDRFDAIDEDGQPTLAARDGVISHFRSILT